MWLLLLGILFDQLSKLWICQMQYPIKILPNLLSFEYVENHGAIFGAWQGSNAILAMVSFAICVALIVFGVIQSKKQRKISLAWYMILAGGIGNLLDRLIRGYVVDFIATPFIATFNIADSFVVLGVIWLLVKEIQEWYQERKEK